MERMDLIYLRQFQSLRLNIADYPQQSAFDSERRRHQMCNLLLETEGVSDVLFDYIQSIKTSEPITTLDAQTQACLKQMLLEYHQLAAIAPFMFLTAWGDDLPVGRPPLFANNSSLALDRFSGAGYTQTTDAPNALVLNYGNTTVEVDYLDVQPEKVFQTAFKQSGALRRKPARTVTVEDVNILDMVSMEDLVLHRRTLSIPPRSTLLFPPENIITFGQQAHPDCLMLRGYMMPTFVKAGTTPRTDLLDIKEVCCA